MRRYQHMNFLGRGRHTDTDAIFISTLSRKMPKTKTKKEKKSKYKKEDRGGMIKSASEAADGWWRGVGECRSRRQLHCRHHSREYKKKK